MAETTNTTSGTTAAKRSGTTRRSTPSARKAPAKTTARRTRTTAKRQTTQAAKASTTAAKATAKSGGVSVERVTLVSLGAALEARDRVVGFASDWYETFAAPLATREGAEKQIRRFERRGTTERNRLEREAKKARTRVERELGSRRRDAERLVRRGRTRVEREARDIERTADRRQNLVTQQVTELSNRVETAVQAGVAAGEKVAKQLTPRA
jgi:hypothetical protein